MNLLPWKNKFSLFFLSCAVGNEEEQVAVEGDVTSENVTTEVNEEDVDENEDEDPVESLQKMLRERQDEIDDAEWEKKQAHDQFVIETCFNQFPNKDDTTHYEAEAKFCMWLIEECAMEPQDLARFGMGIQKVWSELDKDFIYLRGVYTRVDIQKEQLHACYDTRCAWTIADVRPNIGKKFHKLGWTVPLGIQMAEEFRRRNESWWEPYIAMLPSVDEVFEDHPAADRRVLSKDAFGAVYDPYYVRSESIMKDVKVVPSKDEVLWGIINARSRAFANEDGFQFLLPFHDLPNTDTEPNIYWAHVGVDKDKPEQDMQCFKSLRDIDEGEFLSMDYGLHFRTPFEAFKTHGFTLPWQFHNITGTVHQGTTDQLCEDLKTGKHGILNKDTLQEWLKDSADPKWKPDSEKQRRWIQFLKRLCPAEDPEYEL